MADGDCTASGRKCTKCDVFKPWSEFTKAARGRNGRDSRCKGCARAYYESNRLKINARQLARYHKLQEPHRVAKRKLDREAISSQVKRCCRCRVVKPKKAFTKDRNRKDGLKPRCRDCRSVEFKDRVAAGGVNEKSASWKKRNPERSKEIARRHNRKIHNRVHHAISARIYALINGKSGRRTSELLGYSTQELMTHLERQFTKGMSWDNYGEWHIDHIVPLSKFKVENVDDPAIQRAWGLPNLRPLWGIENVRKNAKRTHLI